MAAEAARAGRYLQIIRNDEEIAFMGRCGLALLKQYIVKYPGASKPEVTARH